MQLVINCQPGESNINRKPTFFPSYRLWIFNISLFYLKNEKSKKIVMIKFFLWIF